MAHTCHFSSWEAETGLPQVRGQCGLDSEILLGKEIKRIKASSQRQPKRGGGKTFIKI